MITFTIKNHQSLYEELRGSRSEEGFVDKDPIFEFFKALSEKATKVKSRQEQFQDFPTGEIALPAPLSTIEGKISSDGKNYLGRFEINFKKPDNAPSYHKTITQEKVEALMKKLAACNFEGFTPVNLGDGILLNGGKIPFFALSRNQTLDYLCLCFGKSGTAQRTLDHEEQFEADMNYFAKVLSTIINACYDGEIPDIEYNLAF